MSSVTIDNVRMGGGDNRGGVSKYNKPSKLTCISPKR